jgi:hypothetical protein
MSNVHPGVRRKADPRDEQAPVENRFVAARPQSMQDCQTRATVAGREGDAVAALDGTLTKGSVQRRGRQDGRTISRDGWLPSWALLSSC